MSAGLAASTVTPGTTAPLASLTVPAIALPLWAAALAGNQAKSTNTIHPHSNRVVTTYLYESSTAGLETRRYTVVNKSH